MARSLVWTLSALVIAGAIVSQPATAQSYVGIEIGREDISFKPNYQFVNGSADQSFHNRASGAIGGLVVGHRWKPAQGLSWDLHGRLSGSDNAWRLALPEESATFRYDLPVSLSFSMAPVWQVSDKVALFVEAGVAIGRIRERKQAPITSHYDIRTWRPGLLAGLGAHVALDDRWALRLGYHRIGYRARDFDTFDAAGRQVEAVRSRVTQRETTLALIRAF